MAYNLESLVKILEQILHPEHQQQQPWIILDHHNKPQIQSLLDKASSLNQFLEKCLQTPESLDTQIRDAAHEAEDIIESHIVDRMLSNNPGSITISPPDLQHVINQLDSAMDTARKIMDHRTVTSVSSTPDQRSKDIVVGLDDDLLRLKDRLTGHRTGLEIIPIVGMGGIGKTTLARTLYNDPLVVSHFDVRAWITVSQKYDVREILLGLIECIIRKLPDDELLEKTNNQLAVILHKSLFGNRYLVVVDDVWSTNAWDDIRMFFPNENQRSRILLTTRESDVANYAGSSNAHCQMRPLNEPDSWKLFCGEVLGNEDNCCPVELENIGKTIARNCGGHPLAIHVIGGLLSEADKRTEEFWESVADDTRAAIAGTGDDQLANIFSLSYNYMPRHLRPCFLYMGAFPEDYKIETTKIVKLWVAEGFLKPNGDKRLDEAAEDYVQGLVDRNLITVRQRKSNGKAKSYSIHDLLRDLCARKADEEKFFRVKNGQVNSSCIGQRRVIVHTSSQIRDFYDSKEFMPLARSFLCFGHDSEEFTTLTPLISALRLVRVLDIAHIKFEQFPKEILEMVNLRFLALSMYSKLPSGISRLRHLQTLIFARWDDGYFPSEVWEMPEMRYVKIRGRVLCIEDNYSKSSVQEKLETISAVVDIDGLIRSNLLRTIPNVKKLGIACCDVPDFDVIDLRHLHKLETLGCYYLRPLTVVRFPPCVRKLALVRCTGPWRLMTMLCGSLPNLRVLKLRGFEGEEIETWDETGEFSSLEFLMLDRLNLVHWRVDGANFPRLRHLVLRRCDKLVEIPSGIGEIATLETIELIHCSPSAEASARRIRDEQSDDGNYDLKLRIVSRIL